MDVEAILCALPLVSYYESGSALEDQLNYAFMSTAIEKLESRNPALVQQEYRIIFIAAALAVNPEVYLPGVRLDPEWKADLKRHFFLLNRIHELTKNQILP
jgi:hypothetical protein